MMNTRIRISGAMNEDWPAIEQLLASVGTRAQRHPAARWIVARFGGLVVGCGSIEPLGSAAVLRNLAVAPAHRGRGIGSTLVGVLLDSAVELGATQVCTLAQNREGFFRRLHWQDVSAEEAQRLGLRSGVTPVFAVCLAERVFERARQKMA